MLVSHGQIINIDEDIDFYFYNPGVTVVYFRKYDRFSLTSIIQSCQSTKTIEDWINDKTIFIVKETASEITNKPENFDIQNDVLISRELVQFAATWANPLFSIFISRLFIDIETDMKAQIIQLVTKFEEQKEYFYLIYVDFEQNVPNYTVLQGARAKLNEHEDDRYPEKFKRRWFEIRPVEDPKMLHRKIRSYAPKKFKVRKNSKQIEYDIEFKDLQVTIKSELLGEYKTWIKQFFYNEGYSDKDFIE